MRQLSKTQTAVFIAGAVLMFCGALAAVLQWAAAPWLVTGGALLYAAMQVMQRYDGRNVAIRRLRRIMLLSDVLLVGSGLLMIADQGNPLRLSWMNYLQYVHNKWVVTMLIAAILQIYTAHRIDHELLSEPRQMPE